MNKSMMNKKYDFITYELQKPKSLLLLGYNARSLWRNKLPLEAVLLEYKYDVIFVNETWFNPDKPFQLANQQYQMIHNDDAEGYRGTAIFYKSGLQVYSVKLPESLRFPSISLVKIIMESGKHCFLMTFYNPPKNKTQATYVEMILEYLNTKYKDWSIVIYSDFNQDLRSAHTLPKFMTNHQLQLVVPQGKAFTWEASKTKNSFIDFFFVKGITNQISKVETHKIGTSDHYPISIHLKSNWVQPLIVNKRISVSKRKLQKLISSVVLPSIEEYDKKTSALACLERIIGQLHQKYSAVKRITYKSYFTEFNLVKLLKEGKLDLAKTLLKKQDQIRQQMMIKQLNTIPNKEFYAHAIGLLKLKEIKNHNQDLLNSQVSSIQDPQDPERTITNPTEFSKVLSNHYSEIFHGPQLSFEGGSIKPITTQELFNAIRLIKKDKAVAFDFISDFILKSIKDTDSEVLRFLTNALNDIIQKQQIPDMIACSRLIFLNKNAAHGESSNAPKISDLRPIMISSVIMKCLQAVVLTKLFSITQHLNKAQIGFTKNLETSMHIVNIFGKLLDFQKSKESGFIVFIDFKGAYDKVSHEKLFSKLARKNIDQNTQNLIKFLFHSAKVIIGGWRNHLQKDGGGRTGNPTCNAEVETRSNKTPTTLRRISQIPTPEVPVIEVRRGTPQGSLISPAI